MPVGTTVLGIDHGKKHIGLAICDRQRRLALPLDVIDRLPLKNAFISLNKHIAHYRVGALIIGLALDTSGKEGLSARLCRDFAHRAGRACGLPVALADERFSTHAAHRAIKSLPINRKRRDAITDKIAAAWILQSVLDQWHGDADNTPR